jgi:hypothetical protein
MVERSYQQLEAAGYSRTTLRTLNLVLAKAFGEQTGRTLGAHRPRESDDLRPVWTLAEARCFLDYLSGDRLYPFGSGRRELMWFDSPVCECLPERCEGGVRIEAVLALAGMDDVPSGAGQDLVQSYLVVQVRERDVVLWCVTVHAQLAAITDDE